MLTTGFPILLIVFPKFENIPIYKNKLKNKKFLSFYFSFSFFSLYINMDGEN